MQPLRPREGETIEETREQVPYRAPEWAKKVIWYQIMPERFRNGDPDNDPDGSRIDVPGSWRIKDWTDDWYKRDQWEIELGPEFRDGVFYRRYGGDLQGIIDKLDYIEELGVNALYLNPVFDAKSLHKYDTSYFHHVDRNFGPDPEGDARIIAEEDPSDPSTWKWTSADKLFLELVEEVHRRDMKIIIDGVFNHTGTDFWAFRDIEEKQAESEFAEWYDIISFDEAQSLENEFDYNGWWGIKDLPEFKSIDHNLVQPVKEHIFAMTRRWMDPDGDGDPSDGVDGWRLDVPEEVGQNFWIEWHNLVREINPEALTVAEIWTDNAIHYLNAEQFNSVMNYRFAETVHEFLIGRNIKAPEFDARLRHIRESYPEEANYVLQNLMDTHDTPRLASMIVNKDRKYDEWGLPSDGFDVRKPNDYERTVQRLVSIMQYTYVGVPMIFYGTEAGMWGADDPDDRKPMVWPGMNFENEKRHPIQNEARPEDEVQFNRDLFKWYQNLGEIRNRFDALQTGNYQTLFCEGEVFAFARFDEQEFVVIVINRSDEPQNVLLDLAGFSSEYLTLYDHLTGDEHSVYEDGKLEIELGNVSGVILAPTYK